MTDDKYKDQLTTEEFHVTRLGGTERAFTGRYWDDKGPGQYNCICCGAPLFRSTEKYDSGSGWPSFHSEHPDANIEQLVDRSHGMLRTEVKCKNCDAHLGHLFPDGPAPTGMRYCINSASLKKVPAEDP